MTPGPPGWSPAGYLLPSLPLHIALPHHLNQGRRSQATSKGQLQPVAVNPYAHRCHRLCPPLQERPLPLELRLVVCPLTLVSGGFQKCEDVVGYVKRYSQSEAGTPFSVEIQKRCQTLTGPSPRAGGAPHGRTNSIPVGTSPFHLANISPPHASLLVGPEVHGRQPSAALGAPPPADLDGASPGPGRAEGLRRFSRPSCMGCVSVSTVRSGAHPGLTLRTSVNLS